MTTTTEADHIKSDQFDAYLAVIRSGQVGHADVPALLEANPGFAAWYRRRLSVPLEDRK